VEVLVDVGLAVALAVVDGCAVVFAVGLAVAFAVGVAVALTVALAVALTVGVGVGFFVAAVAELADNAIAIASKMESFLNRAPI
jgi:hypothetical protein